MELLENLKENILTYANSFQGFTWRERVLFPLRIAGRANNEAFYIVESCLRTRESWLEPYLEVKKDEAFVDVGAGVGYYTLMLAGKARHVFAFEPNPKAFWVLKKKTTRLKNVFCFNCALGDKDALHKLHLFYGYERSSLKKPSNRYVIVRCTKIDEVAQIEETRVGLIKIDVEGYEYEVLSGALDTLRKDRPKLIIEVHGREACKNVRYILKKLGYEMKLLRRREDNNWGCRYWFFCR